MFIIYGIGPYSFNYEQNEHNSQYHYNIKYRYAILPKSRTIDREIKNDLFEQFFLLSYETTLEIHFNNKTHGLSTGEESLCKSNPKEQ